MHPNNKSTKATANKAKIKSATLPQTCCRSIFVKFKRWVYNRNVTAKVMDLEK